MITLTIHTNIEHSQIYCAIVALAWLNICGNGYIVTYIV